MATHSKYRSFVRDVESKQQHNALASGSGGGGSSGNSCGGDGSGDSSGDSSGDGGSSAAARERAMTEHGLMLCAALPPEVAWMSWPQLMGFSFTNKCWGTLVIDGLREVQFNDSAFEHLVLPQARKRLVKAVVEYDDEGHMSDLIRGKGEGSVFLFYGPPGVGKTLTAEAVAEMLHRPLYQVSMGELGTTPDSLEAGLKALMDMCSQWRALVLLDEADIFLERRTNSGDLLRNAMVSVVLRMVEYFRGVLFLTTNRVTSFDPAFQTRITVALRYEALTEEDREQIWRNLIQACGYGGCLAVADGDAGSPQQGAGGDVDVKALARSQLNGRAIKNALRLALALTAAAAKEGLAAEEEPTAVTLRHAVLEETVAMSLQFNAELEEGMRM